MGSNILRLYQHDMGYVDYGKVSGMTLRRSEIIFVMV